MFFPNQVFWCIENKHPLCKLKFLKNNHFRYISNIFQIYLLLLIIRLFSTFLISNIHCCGCICFDLGQKNLKKNKLSTMKKYFQLISETILFKGLPDEHIHELLKIAREKEFAKNEMIFFEGDNGDGFYINVEGMVKIFKLSPDGKEQILHIFGPGEPYGEVPVFSGQTFPASAEAISKCKTLFYPRQAIVDLITANPSIALNMLGVLSLRLRQFTVQVENLSLKEVPGRLAAYLLMLSIEQDKTDAITLKISKTQLAGLLGTIPETLSRILNKMAGKGLIDVQGRKIKLLDVDGLEFLAQNGRLE